MCVSELWNWTEYKYLYIHYMNAYIMIIMILWTISIKCASVWGVEYSNCLDQFKGRSQNGSGRKEKKLCTDLRHTLGTGRFNPLPTADPSPSTPMPAKLLLFINQCVFFTSFLFLSAVFTNYFCCCCCCCCWCCDGDFETQPTGWILCLLPIFIAFVVEKQLVEKQLLLLLSFC